MSDDKKAYLSLIQEPISRLSTASSVFKGFSATIVTGMTALSYSEISIFVIILSLVPLLSFFALDIYYLRIERKYRGLYTDVLNDIHEINFSIVLPKDKPFIKRSRARILDCIKSPSILLFYPAMLMVIALVCVLKISEVI